MTRTSYPLVAALCLVILSGCDAMGPESVSAAPATAVTASKGEIVAPTAAYMKGPTSMRSADNCMLHAVSPDPVVQWRGSENLRIIASRPDRVLVRAIGGNGTRGRVTGRTSSGEVVSMVLHIDKYAPNC